MQPQSPYVILARLKPLGKEMIHWGFLILAFIAGFASCYGLIYQVAKIYSQAVEAIEEACKIA
ncbi:hypothetical protein ES705_46764 [subsurface metagenome]